MIPLLAKKRRVIAMDHIGCADSYKPKAQPTIQDYANGVVQLMDGLNIQTASIMGHLLGSYVGIELAAASPERVSNLVLSGVSWIDEKTGPSMENKFKQWRIKGDGSHYQEIWNFFNSRAPRPIDILYRNVLDVLKAGEVSDYGHIAVARYTQMEKRLRLILCPTLLIWAAGILALQGDRGTSESRQRFKTSISKYHEFDVPEGSMFLPQRMPDEIARLVDDFLEDGRVNSERAD